MQAGNDILISHGFEDELNTVVTFLSCWFTRPKKLLIYVENSRKLNLLRWLDWIFLRRYLPSLSLNYVAMSKDIEKRLPQLYYIKMKISYDLGFIAIGVAMAA